MFRIGRDLNVGRCLDYFVVEWTPLVVRSETNATISTLSTRVLTRLFFSNVRPTPLWANLAEETAFIVHPRTQPPRNCGARYGRDEYTTCISVKRWPRCRRRRPSPFRVRVPRSVEPIKRHTSPRGTANRFTTTWMTTTTMSMQWQSLFDGSE